MNRTSGGYHGSGWLLRKSGGGDEKEPLQDPVLLLCHHGSGWWKPRRYDARWGNCRWPNCDGDADEPLPLLAQPGNRP